LAIASMTGYGSADGALGSQSWTWEARSVNGKSLDVRLRLPPGLDAVEAPVKAAAAKRFARGNVSLSLRLVESESVPELRINRPLLDRLIALGKEVGAESGIAPPTLDGLLALRGVVEVVESEETPEVAKAREAAVLKSVEAALDALAKARAEEGARLAAIVVGLIDDIEGLVRRARDLAALQPDAIRKRVRTRLDEILASGTSVSEERLAQELALLAVKADVAEELERLTSHVAQARDLVSSREPAGRRLDFLAQEFNREANTLCSKSTDTLLTRIGLDLKLAVDRLREQAQNVE
jgi:uncharacterized protein (TIGR00255 family)